MSAKPTDPNARKEPLAERYMPGDPIPAAEAVEANSESSWAMFSDSLSPQEADFPETVPASLGDLATLTTPPKKTT